MMNLKMFSVFLLPLFLAIPLNAQDTADETSLKKIIEDETLAFANADLAAWSDFFVHEPYLRWSVSATMAFDGWDALYNGAKSFLESQSGRKDADALHQITRSDWNIHIIGDMAWVKFAQLTEGDAAAVQQFRVLERSNGKWRIAMLVALH